MTFARSQKTNTRLLSTRLRSAHRVHCVAQSDFQNNDKSEYEMAGQPTISHAHRIQRYLLYGLKMLWFPININVSVYFKQCQALCHYVCSVYAWWKCTNILHECKCFRTCTHTSISTKSSQSDKLCEGHERFLKTHLSDIRTFHTRFSASQRVKDCGLS